MRGKVPALPQAMMGRTFRVVDACNFELGHAGGGGASGLDDDFVGGSCGGGDAEEKGQREHTNPLSGSNRSSRRSSRKPETDLESCPMARSCRSERAKGVNACVNRHAANTAA